MRIGAVEADGDALDARIGDHARDFPGDERSISGKGDAQTFFGNVLRELLRWALATGNPACSYLFRRAGGPISRYTFHDALKRITVRLGLGHILFHDLRRTAVTNMIEAGIPPEEARAVSGHLSGAVFDRYNIITAARAKASVMKVGEKMAQWHADKSAADYAKITPSFETDFAPVLGVGSKPN